MGDEAERAVEHLTRAQYDLDYDGSEYLEDSDGTFIKAAEPRRRTRSGVPARNSMGNGARAGLRGTRGPLKKCEKPGCGRKGREHLEHPGSDWPGPQHYATYQADKKRRPEVYGEIIEVRGPNAADVMRNKRIQEEPVVSYPQITTTTPTDIDAAERALRHQLAQIQKIKEGRQQLEVLDTLYNERLTRDLGPVVVYFDQTFSGTRFFHYSAVLTGAEGNYLWYITGPRQMPMTHENFVEFLDTAKTVELLIPFARTLRGKPRVTEDADK
jgi:hypothetical protein